jgi:hypothetical protein
MHSAFKNLVRAALAASLLSSIAHAQLLLSGRITGIFTDSPGLHDTIYNAPDGSYASFKSGVPEHSGFPQTMVEFSQQSFTDIGPGLVADNIFKVTNGRNWLGTTADAAHFDLWVELTSPESHSSLLTPVSFTINNTPNGNTNIDDAYHVSSSPIAPFKIDNTMVQFKFTAPSSFSLHENNAGFVGTLWVNFTPVPEPSTYALTGAGLLLGAALFRAMRRRSTTQLAAV